ncbi:MAG: glycosyltransferase, partial [Planctomycetota bacterium]
LVVAGGGPERERLDALARTLGVRERVHALGVCLPVAPLYAALDALLVSSDQEGTPVVILEALGAGVPVVATAVGGIPDLAEAAPGAIALAPPEVEPLAAVLGGVLADPSRRAAMARAGRRAAPRFGLERLCERTAELYARLLTRSRGHVARRRRCASER